MARPSSASCPECGRPISPEAPAGTCLRCLVGTVLADSGPPEAESPPEPGVTLPQGFDDYEILAEIGRGGMGMVYQARQKSLNRVVALKMMLGGQFATVQARARFKVEAEATAQLQHTHIVAVHEVGEHEGLPYLTMDYVPGRSLEMLAREQPLPARSAATYVSSIAGAIAYAHSQGVLHRDLKPSNVMIDDADQVRITDFGLAKRLPSQSEIGNRKSEIGLTLSGQALGSPNFMPPEQAAGQHQRIGPASDVYGMGATLYYLLTGRPPFVGETITVTTRQVMENEPISPRLLNPKVPRDLETICLKCLEKDPAKRYGTAQELADELDRFLRDEPIRARPPGWVEKGWRWCRRKPALAGAIAVVAALSVLSAATAVRLKLTSGRQQREFYYAGIAQAQGLIRQGSIDRAQETLLQCPEDQRHWEWGYLMAQCHQAILTIPAYTNIWSAADFFVHKNKAPVQALTFDSASRHLGAVGRDGTAKVWELPSGRLLWTRGSVSDPVTALVFHPVQDQVIVVQSNRLQVCFTANGREAEPGIETGGAVLAVAWGDQHQIRAAIERGQELRFLARDPGRPPHWLGWSFPRTEDVRITPDGDRLTIGTTNGTAVLNWRDGQVVGRFERDASWPFGLVLDEFLRHGAALDLQGQLHLLRPDGTERESHVQSPSLVQPRGRSVLSSDGRWVCVAGPTDGAQLVETASGRTWMNFPHRVDVSAFSPDGNRMVVLDRTLAARLYHVATRRVVRILRGHEFLVDQAVFNRNGRLIATADVGGVIKVWSGRAGRELIETGGWTWATTYSPDGRKLTYGPCGAGIFVCDADSGRRLLQLHEERQFAYVARFSPEGRHLATDEGNGSVRIWDLESGAVARTVPGNQRALSSHNYSPDGRLLVTASVDRKVRIWDVRTGTLLHTLEGHSFWLYTAEFSLDGRWLATSGFNDPHVGLWDVETGKRLRWWPAHRPGMLFTCFTPDGRHLATSGTDYTIRIWEVSSGRLTQELPTRGMVPYFDFSSDGRRLVAWSDKAAGGEMEVPSLQIWDVPASRLVLLLEGHSDGGTTAKFHPAGRRILTSSYDETVRQWDAFPWRVSDYASRGPGTLAQRIERHATAYWRERVEADFLNDQPEGAVDRRIFLPFDRSSLPPRDPATPARLLDLTGHYTDNLDGSNLYAYGNDWDNDLRELPHGRARLAGTEFDLRGLIRLRELTPRTGPVALFTADFPERTQPIQVGQSIARIHVLGGVIHANRPPPATTVLKLVWRYDDGTARETPVIYGQHLRSWWTSRDPTSEVSAGSVAWTGSNPAAVDHGSQIRLYHFALSNPRPEVPVASLEWIGALSVAAPFVVAMTAE